MSLLYCGNGKKEKTKQNSVCFWLYKWENVIVEK